MIMVMIILIMIITMIIIMIILIEKLDDKCMMHEKGFNNVSENLE